MNIDLTKKEKKGCKRMLFYGRLESRLMIIRPTTPIAIIMAMAAKSMYVPVDVSACNG